MPRKRPCSTTPGDPLQRQVEPGRVGVRRRARSRGCGAPRRSGRARPSSVAQLARPAAARRAGGACRARRSAPPRPAAACARPGARPAWASRPRPRSAAPREIDDLLAQQRAAAALDQPAGRASTSSAPSSARSSSTEPSSSTISMPSPRASSAVRLEAVAARIEPPRAPSSSTSFQTARPEPSPIGHARLHQLGGGRGRGSPRARSFRSPTSGSISRAAEAVVGRFPGR